MTGIISIRPCDAVKDEQSCPFPKRVDGTDSAGFGLHFN